MWYVPPGSPHYVQTADPVSLQHTAADGGPDCGMSDR